MPTKFINNFSTSLAAAIDDTQTEIPLVDVSDLPALTGGDTYLLTIRGVTADDIEIVRVSSVDDTEGTITVTRAQEGTLAQAFFVGASVQMRLTAGSLNDVEDRLGQAEDAIGTLQGDLSDLAGVVGDINTALGDEVTARQSGDTDTRNQTIRSAVSVGGTSNVITLTMSPVVTGYAANRAFMFIPTAANTAGAVTVNIDTVGARNVKVASGGDPGAGDLAIGQPAIIMDNGTHFVLLNPVGQVYARKYVSAPQTYTGGGGQTHTNGLGTANLASVTVFATCIDAGGDGDYVQGDIVAIHAYRDSWDSSGGSSEYRRGIGIKVNASTIQIGVRSGVETVTPSGVAHVLADNKWSFKVAITG